MISGIKKSVLSEKFRREEGKRWSGMNDLDENSLWLEVLLTQLESHPQTDSQRSLHSELEVVKSVDHRFQSDEQLARLQIQIEGIID